MPKAIEQWLLFKYIEGEFTPLSKPFKTKRFAEKARLEYPERERKTIGLGLIRMTATDISSDNAFRAGWQTRAFRSSLIWYYNNL